MSEAIGIIAGAGQFPHMVALGARAAGLEPVICGFHGHSAPELEEVASAFCMAHLGQFGKIVHFLRERGVQRLCFAGAINKPRALELRPDWLAAKLLFSLREKGDDALFRAIIRLLEGEGFSVVGAAELAPGLRSPQGVLTRRRPTEAQWDDIRFGWPIARTMGRYDIGQCLVVRQGMVMAVECLEGTDATLRRGALLGGAGCVAIKLCKPGQDERVDLPALGLETVRTMIEGQFQALAISAGTTLFFDREAALAEADAHGLCIVSLGPDEEPDALA